MPRRRKNKTLNFIKRNFALVFIFAVVLGALAVLELGGVVNEAFVVKNSSNLLAHAPRGVDDSHHNNDKKSNIKFPVKELGNCASETECRGFCDNPGNLLACVNFAEKNSLMSKNDAAKARKMAELGTNKGPGGCNSASSCETFCSNVNNIRECVAFAKKNGMMDKGELAEAEKVIAALDKGAKLPGGCASKASCDVYCQQPKNIKQCIDFAEAAGFVNKKEAAMIRATGGVGPGGCFGKDACETFCTQADHMVECIEFASKHDLMPAGERDEALKVAAALKKGVKLPGGCTGKASCEAYCMKPENMATCFDFAEAAGFMSKEEAAMARKMMEKGITSGPGGCRSSEACEAFCRNPKNMLECMAFAARHGINTDDFKKEGMGGRDMRGQGMERDDMGGQDENEDRDDLDILMESDEDFQDLGDGGEDFEQ